MYDEEYPIVNDSTQFHDPRIGVGDVVGCCVDYDADQLFFTRNGKILGMLPRKHLVLLYKRTNIVQNVPGRRLPHGCLQPL